MSFKFDYKRMLLIGEAEGFTPAIGSLVGMMRYARQVTLEAVAGLTTGQLDFLYDEKSNSIGMLLFHIASTEKWYQNNTFHLEYADKAEEEYWEKGSFVNREAALTIKGHDLDYYLKLLDEVREETLSRLSALDDNWLNEIGFEWGPEIPMNNWFKWFHVFEDEINHRGQINWLRKRLPK